MTQSDTSGHIQELFIESSLALFRDLSSEVNLLPDEGDEDPKARPCMAFIDASCKDFEILLTLTVPMSVLALTYPVADMEATSDEDLEDWLSELSNMLMGKLKAKLVKYDVEIRLGLPESYFDVEVSQLQIKPTFSSAKYSLLVDHVPVKCSVHVDQVNPNFRFNLDAEAANAPETDGGVLELF